MKSAGLYSGGFYTGDYLFILLYNLAVTIIDLILEIFGLLELLLENADILWLTLLGGESRLI